ncbi:hypothetical protein LLH23_13030 [bacterium]|nr:hypothetical protein [bacterium]
MTTMRAFRAVSCMVLVLVVAIANGQDEIKATMMRPVEPDCLTTEQMSGWGLPASPTSVDVLKCLAVHTVAVTTETAKKGGGIEFIFGGVSGEKESIKVTQDYVNYRTMLIENHKYRVGIGLRVVATFVTKKGGFDLSNIFNVGISASSEQASGQIGFYVLGITGADVTSLIPAPAPLTRDSVTSAITTIAVLKSKIYDPATVILPVRLAQEVDVTLDQNGRATYVGPTAYPDDRMQLEKPPLRLGM